ncbi:MAG: DinB family protein [Gemmatimonadota bacterium]|jgi:uncharacterized damage-inducible protein DinB
MIDMLREMWRYQAWADARLWKAILECDAAPGDIVLRDRTLHAHQAQEAFLGFAMGEAIDFSRTDGMSDPAEIRAYARAVLERGERFLAGPDVTWLDRAVEPPWPHEPPLRFTAAEGMLQAILHSQHHRGQSATRLRELGGTPPTTDLILWIAEGRPEPVWD